MFLDLSYGILPFYKNHLLFPGFKPYHPNLSYSILSEYFKILINISTLSELRNSDFI